VDASSKKLRINSGVRVVELVEGDWVAINGTTGEIIKGQQRMKKPRWAECRLWRAVAPGLLSHACSYCQSHLRLCLCSWCPVCL
jgi:hypothetical protein